MEQAASIGLNITEYENALKMESERARRSKLKGGLTEQGRRNISESMKQRWLQPGFREEYVQSRKTFVHHSKETKERISKVIKQKWADEDYRKRCSERIVPDEVRRKISETLKARWTDPDYRNRMLKGGCYQRSEQQKARIAESIRQKWRDPAYRNAVQSSVRNFYDRDNTDADSEGGGAARTKRDTSSSSYTSSSSSQATKRQRQATRVRERKFEKEDEEERKAQADKIAKINLRLDQRASRSAVLIAAKQAAAAAVQKGTTVNLKEILGDDLWFEEKVTKSYVFLA